jgi:leader peptidase (prepilin peptidase)/N-methyltransferase
MYIYLFVLGLLFGSFYNVVGLRIPRRLSIIKPRSHCTKCDRTLKATELIPVLSYLYQKGKCAQCGTKISPIYPLIEIITATLFTISPLVVGWSKELLIAWSLISLLVIISVSDIFYKLIPNKILLFFLAIIIFIRTLFIPFTPWWDPLLGSFLGLLLLLLIALVSKGGMGMGDVKLFAVLGLFLGWKGIILTLFFSSIFGMFIGGIALLVGLIKRKEPIPFGPSIAVGALTAYFFGAKILEWYLGIIG